MHAIHRRPDLLALWQQGRGSAPPALGDMSASLCFLPLRFEEERLRKLEQDPACGGTHRCHVFSFEATPKGRADERRGCSREPPRHPASVPWRSRFAFIFSLVRPLAAAPDFVDAEGERLVDGHGDTFRHQGNHSATGWFPRATCPQFEAGASRSETAGPFDALIGPAEAARFWTEFATSYHRGGYPLHRGGRLQHRSRAADSTAVR